MKVSITNSQHVWMSVSVAWRGGLCGIIMKMFAMSPELSPGQCLCQQVSAKSWPISSQCLDLLTNEKGGGSVCKGQRHRLVSANDETNAGLNLARLRQKYPVCDSARTEIICLPGPGIENNFVTVSGWMI